MEIISILRVLRRNWLLLVPGCLLTVVIALVLAGRLQLSPPKLIHKQTISGQAQGRLLLVQTKVPSTALGDKLDTSDSLGIRSSLLTALLSTDSLRAQVAAGAGIRPEQLAILGPAILPPDIATPLAVDGSEAARSATEPYVLVANAVGGNVPIIEMRASAPTGPLAAKVMDSATRTLQRELDAAKRGQVEMDVQRLGAPKVWTFVTAPRKVVAVGVAVVFFVLWCAALVMIAPFGRPGRPRRRRRLRRTIKPAVEA